MRIAIASDDGTNIAAHTGQCRGFVIFEVNEQKAARVGYRPNTFTAHAQGRCRGPDEEVAENHSHGPLVDAIGDCRILVTRGLGPRLVADLAAQGIDAYVCDLAQVDDAAQQYARGRLARATGTGCCRHH
jgi:predicted Fe-Mo cluster-binding NifX family protein